MRFRGGYTPKIAGRPASTIDQTTLPKTLRLSQRRGGIEYTPVTHPGQKVSLGDPLGEARIPGGLLHLPAPATGRVARSGAANGEILLVDLEPATVAPGFARHQPERISGEETRQTLARGGIWPFFWSTRSRGVPSLAEDAAPKVIVVNTVLAEPFRARGRVLIDRHWDRIIQGIRFLPRLLADYGRVEIILTHVQDPVARRMYADLAGFAWVRLHPVPLRYPVESPRVLSAAVRAALRTLEPDDDVWLIDVQGMDALGACLAEGLPLHERTVVTGGPGVSSPRHHVARIGTPVRALASETGDPGVRVLRGGLVTGEPLDGVDDTVRYDDDAFFFLPEVSRRELLHFVRPGFDRTSYLPVFATALTGAPDRAITTSLRGERRPCIACGLCEAVCPARILPQVIHRYLYRDSVEQAERVGLERCVDCNLCTFVCPSKIELAAQFADARRRIHTEREAERAATAAAQDTEREGA